MQESNELKELERAWLILKSDLQETLLFKILYKIADKLSEIMGVFGL